MNSIRLSSISAVAFLLLHFTAFAQDIKIEVVDFHSTNRCMTCNSIEAHAKKTVETFFADNAIVSFSVYNVDEEKNKTIAEEFKTTGTSLYLKITKGGKSQIVNLTQFAFMNGRNEEKFMVGLKKEIDKYL